MIDPNKDGIDHINIYSKANTQLGRLLSNWAHIPFEHPEDGHFHSVEGYWYWLKLEGHPRRDELRALYGFRAKDLGRTLAPDRIPLPVKAREKIKQALRLKTSASSELRRLMMHNELPYKHYYVYGGLVREPQSDKWLVEFIAELTLEIQRNR